MANTKGKIVLITGATSGIGKEIARGLARLGATVVFTTRDDQKGAKTREDLIQSTGNTNIDMLHCDLASLDSIRACVLEFKRKYAQLHVLINNAGTWDFTRRESKDGIENIFATNYLAPFLMTNLLLDVIKQSNPSQIINIAAGLHRGTIHFDDIEFKQGFSGLKAYSQSKLALILFTRLLAKKLESTGVRVNCVHPGVLKTNLGRDAGRFSRLMFKIIRKNPQAGAETPIFLASDPTAANLNGEYLVKKQVHRSSKTSHDLQLAQQLWDLSIKYVKL